jgi:hypothetical protein
MDWSIEVQGQSPYEVGGLVLRVLQDRYMARIEGYDVSLDGRISVSVGLPQDPWTRLILVHRAQVDRNEVFTQRARRLVDMAADHVDHVRAFIRGVAERLPIH